MNGWNRALNKLCGLLPIGGRGQRRSWLVTLGNIAVCALVVSLLFVPGTHALVCKSQPGKTRYAIAWTLQAMNEHVKDKITYSVLDRSDPLADEVIRVIGDIPPAQMLDYLPFPPVCPDSLNAVLCIRVKTSDALLFIFDQRTAADSSAKSYALAPFPRSGSARENLRYLRFILRRFAAGNDTTIPGLNADALVARAEKNATYHLSHLWNWRWEPWRKVPLMFCFWWSVWTIIAHLMYTGEWLTAARRVYGETATRGTLAHRPRYWSCFFATDRAEWLERYRRYTQSLHQERLHTIRTAERERRRMLIAQEMASITLAAELRGLKQRAQAYFTESPDLKIRLLQAGNDHESLERRRDALAAVRMELSRLARETAASSVEQMEAPEERLVRRAGAVDINRLTDSQREQFHNCLQQYRSADDRQSCRIYWLIRALAVCTEAEPVVSGSSIPIEATPVVAVPRPFTEQDFISLLDVDNLLPVDVDHHHATAIIVWGLVRPGQRGHACFGKRYLQAERILQKVKPKLGDVFDPQAFREAFAWLLQQRIVLPYNHKRHQITYRLNPNSNDASLYGRPIIDRIVEFNQRVQRGEFDNLARSA